MELARNVAMDQAVTISENVLAAPLFQLAFGLDPLLLLGLPLVVFGLCRAGVLGLVDARVGGRRDGAPAVLPGVGQPGPRRRVRADPAAAGGRRHPADRPGTLRD